ncbi:MAG: hypothetical protein HY360_12935, partial [Verrucomicrobia bacterium]|nr:hypothetical protein [Verrucomicrobiota bacterium]
MMFIDKGLNDQWVRPQHLKRVGAGRYTLTLQETLGKHWPREIVSYPLPIETRNKTIHVSCDGVRTPCQRWDDHLAILVENLRPDEERVYELECSGASVKRRSLRETDGLRFTEAQQQLRTGLHLTRHDSYSVFSNGILSLKLPATQSEIPARPCPQLGRRGQAGGSNLKSLPALARSLAGGVRQAGQISNCLPGPIVAVRRGEGPWLGRGRLESPFAVRSITTRLIEQGELWTTAEVLYTFEGGYTYRMRIKLRPDDEVCDVEEESTLPVRLWPAPRPYREIGTLGKSFWDQPLEAVAKPCIRPCPTSNFIFEVNADRMITHSTGSWEIMDMPLEGETTLGRVVGSPSLTTYTAMRPALPFIDGGWMGVYHCRRDELFG